jgi:hypothetical protein
MPRPKKTQVKARPSPRLLRAIDQAARDEVFDAREWLPSLEQDRMRVAGLLGEAKTAAACLSELERICELVGLEESRNRLLERVHDLRFLLLRPDTGWLVVDQLESRSSGAPSVRKRRQGRLSDLMELARAEGVSSGVALQLIARRWYAVWKVEWPTLTNDTRRRLWGGSRLPHDGVVKPLTDQLRKLLVRQPRKRQNPPAA